MNTRVIQVAALAFGLAIITACSGPASPGSGSPSASPTPSAAPVTFHDEVGEVPKGKPDIATVTVAKQNGKITFAIEFVNSPPLVTDQKSSGFWDLLGIVIDPTGGNVKTATVGQTAVVREYRLLGETPTLRGGPNPNFPEVGSLPGHIYLSCTEGDQACLEVPISGVDIGPVTVAGHTLTVSVDPGLLGYPTTLGFRVIVTRGTEPKLPEYSPGNSQDWAPTYDIGLWSWRVS